MKIDKCPHEIFMSIDKRISCIQRKIGFKKIGKIVDDKDPSYWEKILSKMRLSFIGVVLLGIALYVYNGHVEHYFTNNGLIGKMAHNIPSDVFFILLGISFCSFIVIQNFANGKEKLKGNDRIQWIHLYYMFGLPVMFSLALSVPSWIY